MRPGSSLTRNTNKVPLVRGEGEYPSPFSWSPVFIDLERISSKIYGYKGLKSQNLENKELRFRCVARPQILDTASLSPEPDSGGGLSTVISKRVENRNGTQSGAVRGLLHMIILRHASRDEVVGTSSLTKPERPSEEELAAGTVSVDVSSYLVQGLNTVQYNPVGRNGKATVTVNIE